MCISILCPLAWLDFNGLKRIIFIWCLAIQIYFWRVFFLYGSRSRSDTHCRPQVVRIYCLADRRTAAQWPFCVEFCREQRWPRQIAGNLRCPMPQPASLPRSSGHSIKNSFPTGWSLFLPPFFLSFTLVFSGFPAHYRTHPTNKWNLSFFSKVTLCLKP